MGNHSQPQIRISVRNLVEFVMRSGDLDNRRTAGAKKEAMQAGSRLHRKIQKRMGTSYRSEVMLRHQVQEDMFDILVEGRADGIITEPAGVTIDEIKCIYMDVSRLEEPDPSIWPRLCAMAGFTAPRMSWKPSASRLPTVT